MAKLNISQAAKAAGIARGTLYNHIHQGKISYELDQKGDKVIDTSELLRVYGELKTNEASNEQSEMRSNEQHDTLEITGIAQVLKQRINDLEQQIEDLRKDKEDLQQDKDYNRKREEELLSIIKQQQMLLLPSGVAKKQRFFSRLFGSKKQN
jgi:predicted site-specific integrase-resolvase